MNSYSTSWWSLLLINRPSEDERLSWPCWLTYNGRFTHINGYPSAASPVQTSKSSPVRDRRSTTEPPNQLLIMINLYTKFEVSPILVIGRCPKVKKKDGYVILTTPHFGILLDRACHVYTKFEVSCFACSKVIGSLSYKIRKKVM